MNGTTTVLTGPGTLEQREYPVPDPQPGGVVLDMVRANVCGSEVHILKGHHPLIQPGCALGHEGVGRVSRLGEGVTTDFAGVPLSEGDRVVATYFEACRRCPACNRGEWPLCGNAYRRWATPADEGEHFYGTFGTHWCLSGNQYVYRVPDGASSKAVSSANCALSQMVAAVDRAQVRRGESVVLLGAGGLGLCGAALCRESGAEVWVAEMAPSRLAKAEQFGAQHTLDLTRAQDGPGRVELVREATGGSGADVVIDLTGVPDAFAEGVQMVRPAGRFISVGNISPGRVTQFDPGLFTRSGVTIHGVIRYPVFALSRSIAFIEATPQYPWEDLVDADYAFTQAREAIQAAEDKVVTRAALVIADE